MLRFRIYSTIDVGHPYVIGLRKSSILLDYSIAYYVEFSLTFCLFPLLDRPSVLAFEEIDPCLKNNALLS